MGIESGELAVWVCLAGAVLVLVCLGDGLPARLLLRQGVTACAGLVASLGVFTLAWTYRNPSAEGPGFFGWVIGLLLLVCGALGVHAGMRATRRNS